eukprot:5407218-Prymnesium_polylepis.3
MCRDLNLCAAVCAQVRSRKLEAEQAQLREMLAQEHKLLEAEVVVSRERLAKLQAAEKAWKYEKQRATTLEDRVEELEGGVNDVARRAKLEEREKRIEHLKQMATLRLKNQGTTRGWVAWHHQWEDRRNRRRLVNIAVVRLRAPRMFSTFNMWHTDWSAAVSSQRDAGKITRTKEAEETLRETLDGLRAELERVQVRGTRCDC